MTKAKITALIIIILVIIGGFSIYRLYSQNTPSVAFCPIADKVFTAVRNNQAYVKVSIGKWNAIILNNPKNLSFKKASYISGKPSCLYVSSGNLSVGLTPDVGPELFPGWPNVNLKVDPWNAPDCIGSVSDCPWSVVPWKPST